ncbi:MAG: dethiobiotin synthase [Gallionella sp.]|nr:dethiobiotin synthase [Gallionella sp.]MDD4946283.1 dethiobiotin synthase [Gallionella sp.]
MSYFVTGTDTDVGKTLISCALLHGLAAQGKTVAGFKPVAAGCDDSEKNEDALRLRAAANVQVTYGQVNPYCFPQPVAPHLAARFIGVRINLQRIVESYRELAGLSDAVVVEGAGGFCVPLNEREDSVDMARLLGLPVILVVGLRLGCLNHALLTARAIAAAGLPLAGWVANCVDGQMSMRDENIAALQQRLDAPLLGIVPHLGAAPQVHEVAACLDLGLLAAGKV